MKKEEKQSLYYVTVDPVYRPLQAYQKGARESLVKPNAILGLSSAVLVFRA